MILIRGILLAAALFQSPQQQTAVQDPAPAVRRLAATTQLAAQEYRLGVANGRVVAPEEVAEAKLFLGESRAEALKRIENLLLMIDQVVAPEMLDRKAGELTASLSAQYGITIDSLPPGTPSLARGAAIYRENCSSCHGDAGRGDGASGRGLDPKPADLSAGNELRTSSPL